MIDTYSPDWTALEVIDRRRREHGESMSAAIQFAKAHHAFRIGLNLLGNHLSFTHSGNFYTGDYPRLIREAFADAVGAIEQWERLR